MAYAEKRGKGPQPWRVKYKLPSGLEASESRFETKAAALAWGRDQEARIREGRWTDANAGKITVSEWIDRWLAMQDVGVSTVDNREYLIRRFIRPAWGASALNSLSTEEITKWENALPARTRISQRTARAARSLLGTILGDAATAKPPLIPYNPALRARNRGRRTGRKLELSPQRAWAIPLQALLLAERAALLSGRDDDFSMIVTIGYTGLRWGETIGLERGLVRASEIHVEWQLREVNGRFYRLPPKDDSYRSPKWEPNLPVDLPEFLTSLIDRQIQSHPRRRCACAEQHGGSGQYVFLGPDGGHYRRSNYARPCSALPATGGTKQHRPAPAGWSSPTPPSGRASRSPPGRPPSRAPAPTQASARSQTLAQAPTARPPTTHRPEAAESRPARRTSRLPAGFRSSSALPRTACVTATRHGWPKMASPRSSPSSDSATKCQGCAACTPTPRTGCATNSRQLSRPAGKSPCAPARPSTRTRRSGCSTSCWHHTAAQPGNQPSRRHHDRHNSSRRHLGTGRR